MPSISAIKINNLTYSIGTSTPHLRVSSTSTDNQTINVNCSFASSVTQDNTTDLLQPIIDIRLTSDVGYLPGTIIIDGVDTEKTHYSIVGYDGMSITASSATQQVNKDPLIVQIADDTHATNGCKIALQMIDGNYNSDHGTIYWSYTNDRSTAVDITTDDCCISCNSSNYSDKVYLWSDDLNVDCTISNKANKITFIKSTSYNIDCNSSIKTSYIKLSGTLTGLIDVSKKYNKTTYKPLLGYLFGYNSNNFPIDAGELDIDTVTNYAVQANVDSIMPALFISNTMKALPHFTARSIPSNGYSYMFANCGGDGFKSNSIDLPAMHLGSNCYNSMFRNIGTLTKISYMAQPETCGNNCYQNMFNGCNNLTEVLCLLKVADNTQYTNNWLNNVANTGTFTKRYEAQWSTGSSGIPAGWTVIEN